MGTGMTTTMNTITPMANEDAVAIATDFFHCESSSTRERGNNSKGGVRLICGLRGMGGTEGSYG